MIFFSSNCCQILFGVENQYYQLRRMKIGAARVERKGLKGHEHECQASMMGHDYTGSGIFPRRSGIVRGGSTCRWFVATYAIFSFTEICGK